MPVKDIVIRRAEDKDCKQLMDLIQELADYERAPNEVTITLAHFKESGFGENPVWWAFVAEIDETLIGFALYYIRFSTWKGKRMYLEDLLVSKEYRRKGVGKLLMDVLIQEAKNKNLHGISWQVLEWNKPAIQFYKNYNASYDEQWWNVSITL